MTPNLRVRQREATRRRIADEAGRLFAERGFDRTSVREVAAAAGVDPALVMHYFGSKRKLFREVLGDPGSVEKPVNDATQFVLDAFAAKIDGQAHTVPARLRSMLTNEDAKEHVRDRLETVGATLAASLNGQDRQARAHLLLAIGLGVVVSRELLGVEALSELDTAALVQSIRPAVVALVGAEVDNGEASGSGGLAVP